MLRVRAGMIAVFAAAAVLASQGVVNAQTTPRVYFACYVPLTGTVYRIREAGLKTGCTASHIEFSWTDGANAIRTNDPLGGDLAGVLANATVVKLLGRALANVAPAIDQVLGWDGHAWIPLTQSAGQPGPVGPTGPAGPQGVPGHTGPQGAAGAAGTNGVNGPPGALGQTGAAGSDGPRGDPGPSGPTGPQGSQGADGAIGATGATGPTGPANPKNGANGGVGPFGPTGPEGIEGEAGAQGQNGAVGATGPAGPAGFTGTGGPIGHTGNTGPAPGNGWLHVPTFATTIQPGSFQTLSITCPVGKVILDGWFSLGLFGAIVVGHFPRDSTTWDFVVKHDPIVLNLTGSIRLNAVCVNAN